MPRYESQKLIKKFVASSKILEKINFILHINMTTYYIFPTLIVRLKSEEYTYY